MIKRILTMIISFPKSLFVNFKLFGLQGVKCPILISYNTKLAHLEKGSVQLKKPSFGCVKIGFDGTEGIIPVNSGGGILK